MRSCSRKLHNQVITDSRVYLAFCVLSLQSSGIRECLLVPRPPPFLPSIYVHYNTWNWTICEKLKRGRPGSIHHVSGHEVGHRGEGPIFKNICTNSFHHAKVWSPKTQ